MTRLVHLRIEVAQLRVVEIVLFGVRATSSCWTHSPRISFGTGDRRAHWDGLASLALASLSAASECVVRSRRAWCPRWIVGQIGREAVDARCVRIGHVGRSGWRESLRRPLRRHAFFFDLPTHLRVHPLRLLLHARSLLHLKLQQLMLRETLRLLHLRLLLLQLLQLILCLLLLLLQGLLRLLLMLKEADVVIGQLRRGLGLAREGDKRRDLAVQCLATALFNQGLAQCSRLIALLLQQPLSDAVRALAGEVTHGLHARVQVRQFAARQVHVRPRHAANVQHEVFEHVAQHVEGLVFAA